MTALALLDHVPAWHANKLSIRALFVFCLVSGTVHTGIPDSSRLASMLMVATLLVQNTEDTAPIRPMLLTISGRSVVIEQLIAGAELARVPVVAWARGWAVMVIVWPSAGATRRDA